HSSEASPSAWRSKGGSSAGTGRSNLGSGRRTGSSLGTGREPTSKRGGSRTPRNIRPPTSEQPPTWSESDSFRAPEPFDSQQSRVDEPRTFPSNESRPQRLGGSERNPLEERGSRRNQIFDFRSEGPPAIRPLPITQIEEPDMLIEDYNQAQD